MTGYQRSAGARVDRTQRKKARFRSSERQQLRGRDDRDRDLEGADHPPQARAHPGEGRGPDRLAEGPVVRQLPDHGLIAGAGRAARGQLEREQPDVVAVRAGRDRHVGEAHGVGPDRGAMTMTKQTERLPRPAAELERLAEYYDTHDTSAEMEPGHWADPHPMATTGR